MKFREFLNEAKMTDAEVLSVAKKLAKNGKNEKTKDFGQGLVDFYEKNKSFTPVQVSGLQNIMKNAGFNLAESDLNENNIDTIRTEINNLLAIQKELAVALNQYKWNEISKIAKNSVIENGKMLKRLADQQQKMK